jgi:hypothetical protein
MLLSLAVLPPGEPVRPQNSGPPVTGRPESGTLADTGARPGDPDAATPGPEGRGDAEGGPDEPAAPKLPTLAPAPVEVDIDGFLAWALLDRNTGEISGSRNYTRTSTTQSMIKVWIVADFLRRTADRGDEPSDSDLAAARAAIRDSNDNTTMSLYLRGGDDAVVARMIDICHLTETSIFPGWWSRTRISARDAARLGDCVASGAAAGPEWTDWVLAEMRKVRGSTAPEDQPAGGRWGIIDGLPEPMVRDGGVAIKNGWTRIGADNNWHLNCLALADSWVLAVLMRYPAERSLDYGAARCADVASQLVLPPAPAGSPQRVPD